jgi:hypothetical protein
MCKRRLQTAISLHRDSVGEPGKGVLLPGTLERQMKEASGNGTSLSMGALGGEPGGWAALQGNLRICILRIWKWTSFSIGSLLGSMEECSFSRALRESCIFYQGMFIREFERYVKGDSKRATVSTGLRWGTWSELVYRVV